MGLLDRITALFGRSQPATVPTTADETAPRRVEPYDLAGQMQADNERRATVKTCREMYRKDPRARGVIKALARDMTRGGFTVTVKGNREAESLAQELNARLQLDSILDDWVRLTLRDGDTFLELGVDGQNNIAIATRKPTLQMRRNSDLADRFSDPTRAYWLAPDHWFGGEPPADAPWFADWQIIHARWDHDAEERYGQPLFASATSAYKRIKEGETDIAVRRKTRAGVKYNHQFPEGTTADQIEQYKELNQDNLNDPTAAISDYFGTAQISVIAGDGASLEAIGDVLHHVRTWWLASPVPMSLLGYGQDLNRDVLQEQKEQYDRALESLTQWVEGQFVRPLLERQWLLKGILPAGLQYEVKWKTTETLKVATVVNAAAAVKALTDAGMPRVAAWEMVERFLPGVDLTQAKAEMQANAEEMQRLASQTQQMQQAQPQAPAQEPPVTRQEAQVLGEVVAEYQRAAQMLERVITLDEFNPYHDRLGKFASAAGGGSAPVAPALTNHAMQRMRERGKYASVKDTLGKLIGHNTPPGDWYCPMQRKGKLDGYLVGTDGVVKTVLGPWYNVAKLRGEAIMLAEAQRDAAARLSLRRSIQWQLDNLTADMADKFCELAEVDRLSVADFRAAWRDWTADGLESLLIARSEVEDAPAD